MYKFIGTEKDLIDNGFKLWNTDCGLDYIREVNDEICVYICLEFRPYNGKVMNDYGDDNLIKDEHIQDLLDKGIIIKENK